MRAHIDHSALYTEISTLFKYLNNNNNNNHNQTALKKIIHFFSAKIYNLVPACM